MTWINGLLDLVSTTDDVDKRIDSTSGDEKSLSLLSLDMALKTGLMQSRLKSTTDDGPINGLFDLVSTTNYADKRIIRLSTTKLRSGTPMKQVQRMTGR
jgi:hypothetical protein